MGLQEAFAEQGYCFIPQQRFSREAIIELLRVMGPTNFFYPGLECGNDAKCRVGEPLEDRIPEILVIPEGRSGPFLLRLDFGEQHPQCCGKAVFIYDQSGNGTPYVFEGLYDI